jgi:thiamine-phosphate pyrophosphorylase
MDSSFFHRNLDASLNRAAEGLRVLMDLVRFGLDLEEPSARLKHLRHRLIHAISGPGLSHAVLLEHRDSLGDVSRPGEASPLPPPYCESLDLFEANCRRVEEALRSMEETLRLLDPMRAREAELIRYEVYDLQKEIHPLLFEKSHRRKMDFELYVVTDRRFLGGKELAQVVEAAVKGGAGCIQLREKHADIRSVLNLARELRKVTRESGATFIINDSLEVALETGADGVHLGQEDLPLEAARRLAGGQLLIGISTHNPEQAFEAEAGGAGYINIGPVFATNTKDTPVQPVTLDLIRQVAPCLRVPFTTMGGIHLGNVEQVILAGADRVAVVTEVMAAANPEAAAREMLAAIRRAKEKRAAVSP